METTSSSSSIFFGEQSRDGAAWAVLDTPEAITIGRLEDLKVVDAVMLPCVLLQDSEACQDRLVAKSLDCAGRCKKWLVRKWAEPMARIRMIERRLLWFKL